MINQETIRRLRALLPVVERIRDSFSAESVEAEAMEEAFDSLQEKVDDARTTD